MRVLDGFSATVASDGRTLEVADADGVPAFSLTFAIPGEAPDGWVADEEEIALLETDRLRTRLRSDVEQEWRLALSVDNLTAEPLELSYCGLGVVLAPGWVGWSWTCDLHGFLVLSRGDAEGPSVLLRVLRGFFQPARELPCFLDEGAGRAAEEMGRGAFHLAPPQGRLGAHRRHQVELVVQSVDGPVGPAALPAWLPDVVVPTGLPIELRLPDHGVVPGPGVNAQIVDTDVILSGQPGHREVGVHGPRGVEKVRLAWAPPVEELVPAVVAHLLQRRAAGASDAAGFIVADAVARGRAADPEAALDWLEQVDWLRRDSLLGCLTAGLHAAAIGERPALDAAWEVLGRRPVEPGYGLGVLRLWTAAFAIQDVREVARGLLARTSADAAVAAELALLSQREEDKRDARLRGLIATLGGELPGRPLGLTAVRGAVAIALLRLCPEDWVGSLDAALAADKAEQLLLADYAGPLGGDGPAPTSLDGLAWLLVGDVRG